LLNERNTIEPTTGGGSLRRAVDAVTMGLNVIGTVLILAIMLLVNADVIGRGAFGAPISGVPEMVSMSIVAIVFLQVAQTFRMGRLTRSDALLNTLRSRSTRFRALVELLFCLAATFIMMQLLNASWPLFVKSWKRNTFEGTIGDFTAPIWPVKLIILIGCAVLIIQLLLSAWDALRQLRAGSETRP
jgi:TRAP-type mannitol/chloroaromatic compound transport system permease small subunit